MTVALGSWGREWGSAWFSLLCTVSCGGGEMLWVALYYWMSAVGGCGPAVTISMLHFWLPWRSSTLSGKALEFFQPLVPILLLHPSPFTALARPAFLINQWEIATPPWSPHCHCWSEFKFHGADVSLWRFSAMEVQQLVLIGHTWRYLYSAEPEGNSIFLE